MAAAKIKRRKKIDTARTEFFVPLARVLADLLDPDQVEPGDTWVFAQGDGGLTIWRERTTETNYDENGNGAQAQVRAKVE
jgi:hypothetical protein